MHLPPDFRALALEQDGVFTAADAREHGINRSAAHRRVRAGEWVSVHPRVYRSPTTPRPTARESGPRRRPSALTGSSRDSLPHGGMGSSKPHPPCPRSQLSAAATVIR
ncbi:type IV toxin-antitoxin system AbiEi family antitoxin domain-containing protein [Gordonia sp. WA4-43]|uniref:type IV toxin-antitoxin system AbiEi family antitoxin domain-containing protein n=1 Tax=Gordonia sp. WA4-43 TaxID=2878678 RepID=UPI00299E7B57|nr:type IV toxin-antitoxin system AbiEi family antitoxin domain-containing protein [Gordonia sp. WA4-43]